ncbi:hypothetical protein OHAE_3497 [Ochrobactrum soli]|uniref:Uncharacterized protein n=2 Tax=Brucella/Ochrobactrum group TaxID=2826938 RepID=A0A2P9HHH1_9HYPH|nr:hypothetical protein OHAE_3497 [[Ochrobactrum] soli]
MLPERIYSDPVDVDARLQQFSFNRSELLQVAFKTIAERANTIDGIDVATARGTLSYIHGNRHLRLLAISKGYEIKRDKNIELSRNPVTGAMVTYQNVDQACTSRWPKAISAKKTGSAHFIDLAQGALFTEKEAPNAVDLASVQHLNSTAWYFCMSFDEETFSAELSLPAKIKNNNFHGFYERIFIAYKQEWARRSEAASDDEFTDIIPIIHRK